MPWARIRALKPHVPAPVGTQKNDPTGFGLISFEQATYCDPSDDAASSPVLPDCYPAEFGRNGYRNPLISRSLSERCHSN